MIGLYFSIAYLVVCCSLATASEKELSYQKETLEYHNYYRAMHDVPMMALDDGLNDEAQSYAEFLAKQNTGMHHCKKRECNQLGAGENLAIAKFGTSINASKAWYDEIKYYDFCASGERAVHRPGHEKQKLGHFTQLVWKESVALGVGIARTKDGQTTYIVARYKPPGNVIGHYKENVELPQYMRKEYNDDECGRHDGGFTDWLKTECTQECGGGVYLEKRTCSAPLPSINGRDCHGPTTQLASKEWCNTQKCDEDNSLVLQCSARGITNPTMPATGRCLLFCSEPRPVALADDGTHCDRGKGACVRGKCEKMASKYKAPKPVKPGKPVKPVKPNKRPNKKETTKTGGSSRIVSGSFTSVPKKRFFKNRLFTIPSGAYDIKIENGNVDHAEIFIVYSYRHARSLKWWESNGHVKTVSKKYNGVEGFHVQYNQQGKTSTLSVEGPVVYSDPLAKVSFYVRRNKQSSTVNANIKWSYSIAE